jgi:hypothetical protein
MERCVPKDARPRRTRPRRRNPRPSEPWAHQEPFTGDDTDRALDSIARLLTAVSAPQADELNKMKMELRRLIFEEQARSERRKKPRGQPLA